MLRGKFIAISAYIKKSETSEINNLMIYFKFLEKQEETKPKNQQIERNIKDEIKTKQTVERVNETKSQFFEKVNKINKPLANMIKPGKEMIKINKIRVEKGYINPNTNEIQRIITEYFENLYTSKLENLDEMDKFLDA
jgi:hypothetical protein